MKKTHSIIAILLLSFTIWGGLLVKPALATCLCYYNTSGLEFYPAIGGECITQYGAGATESTTELGTCIKADGSTGPISCDSVCLGDGGNTDQSRALKYCASDSSCPSGQKCNVTTEGSVCSNVTCTTDAACSSVTSGSTCGSDGYCTSGSTAAASTTTTTSIPDGVNLINPLATSDVRVILGTIIKAALGLSGSIALLMFILGGFLWLTAGGNPEKIEKGKQVLIWATVGLIVIFFAYTIVTAVIKAITVGTV